MQIYVIMADLRIEIERSLAACQEDLQTLKAQVRNKRKKYKPNEVVNKQERI